ncbi:MAG: EAL domain-containing protein [Myxococcota bacterium]
MDVLLIEDDEADALLFRKRLASGVDASVHEARSLREGLAVLETSEPDVVVMDLNLSDSTGLETLETFLGEAGSPPPVVVLTGHDDEEMALAAVQAGAQEYLAKGMYEPRVLAKALRHAVERHALAQNLLLANERVHFLATHCGLTELPNRYLLMDRLEHALKGAARRGAPIAVLFIDLDGFKLINDSAGHRIGDAVLVEVAKRLKAELRESDTSARIGGDEFVVLLSNIRHPRDAFLVASKLANRLSEPMRFADTERDIAVGASIGIALFPDNGTDAEMLLANADAAMYRAKSTGEACCYYTRELQEETRHRADLEAGLRRALERDEFVLHYQPRVDGRTGSKIGVEALLRWHHPRRGLVPPGDFIPVAEQSGLIDEMGAWVLRHALLAQARWIESGKSFGPVSINVAPRQLCHGDFDRLVVDALEEAGLPGSELLVEITESSLVREIETSRRILGRLRDRGVRVAVDDFGTGFCNLSLLPQLPLDELKVDRSFVVAATRDDKGAMTARSIIGLGHGLGLEVVAEGVETQAQRAFLLRNGCHWMQGFFFSKPLSEDALFSG